MNTQSASTGEMCRGGSITANADGSIIIERDSGYKTTIGLEDGEAVRVDFWPAGKSTKAHVELIRDDARGWSTAVWGDGIRIEALDPSHATVHVEFSSPRADQVIRVAVLEPYRRAIEMARGMLERCGKVLEAIGASGGRPAELLLHDLRRQAYIE